MIHLFLFFIVFTFPLLCLSSVPPGNRVTLNHNSRYTKKIRNLLEQTGIMPHAHGAVVGGGFLKPLVVIHVRVYAKIHLGLGISDIHNRLVRGHALGNKQLECSVHLAGKPQGRNRPRLYLGFNGDARATFSVVHPHAAQDGLLV